MDNFKQKYITNKQKALLGINRNLDSSTDKKKSAELEETTTEVAIQRAGIPPRG